MTDRDFELLLQESISDLPPSDTLVEDITPWRKAMNRILWGLGLMTVTLNFWNLDTILPAMGMVLMLLGFRALRHENGWFRAGFILAVIRSLWLLASIFLNATIYSSEIGNSNAAGLCTYAMLTVGFFHLICLRGGIRAVQKKAGLEPHSGSANALLVFYLVLVALAILNFEGFAVWLLLIAYICILRGLFKLSRELDDAGYVITPDPPRVADRAVMILYTAVIALLLAVGYLFFGQYEMDWTAAQPQSDCVAEVRAELLELGFPENILNDLTEEEIFACQGAKAVYVDTEDLPASDGYEVYEQTGRTTHIYTEYKARELRITAVAVEPEDPASDWVVIHHFLWTSDPGYRGTEAMQIWPTYRGMEGWVSANRFSGRVLYDEGETTFAAPYQRLEEVFYTYYGFFGQTDCQDIVATFSLPKDGENCRGYVCYGVKSVEEGWLLNSWCNYFYQQTFLQYPVGTAEEALLSGNFGYNDAIKAVQTAIQLSQDERDNYHVIGGE